MPIYSIAYVNNTDCKKMFYSLNTPTISSVILFLESISLISSSDRRLSVKETTQNKTNIF